MYTITPGSVAARSASTMHIQHVGGGGGCCVRNYPTRREDGYQHMLGVWEVHGLWTVSEVRTVGACSAAIYGTGSRISTPYHSM